MGGAVGDETWTAPTLASLVMFLLRSFVSRGRNMVGAMGSATLRFAGKQRACERASVREKERERERDRERACVCERERER